MTTYPANIEVLNKDSTNETMDQQDTTAQTMYTLSIPANTLDVSSRLRIGIVLSRVTGVPISNVDLSCCRMDVTSLPPAQDLSEVSTYRSTSSGSPSGSFSYVGDDSGQESIYQAVYANEATLTGTTFDDFNNFKLWHILSGRFTRVARVASAASNPTGINAANLVNGVSDEHVYALRGSVALGALNPVGLYLYFVTRDSNTYIGNGVGYDTWCVSEGEIFASASVGLSPTFQVDRFNLGGTQLATSTGLAVYGNTYAIAATPNYLYAICTGNTIVRMNRSTLGIIQAWSLSSFGQTVRSLYAPSDDVIYISGGSSSGTVAIGYFLPSDGSCHVIDAAVNMSTFWTYNDGFVFPSRTVMSFLRIDSGSAYFYIGQNGSNIISKIGPLVCG